MVDLAIEKVQLEELSSRKMFSETTPDQVRIVAEGDSWFAYPLAMDIIDHLRRMGYAIKRYSKAGDTLENMVYGSDYRIDNHEVANHGPVSLQQTIRSIKDLKPRFVLFSAGGNDIVGKEFEQYLHHKDSGLPLLKEATFKENLNGFMKTAIVKFLESVWAENANIDILMDGYDYAQPNGTKYEVFSLGVAGPWLLPGFGRKNIVDKQADQIRIIKWLVDEFNTLLASLDAQYPKFHHIDLRGRFPNEREWDNEIHLKSEGFKTVASLYHTKMTEIVGQNPLLA